jgi:S-adenosylmethionine synthetase
MLKVSNYTTEAVRKYHPDKFCDLIADSILDLYLEKDPLSRVAIDVTGSGNRVNVFGEVSSKAELDNGTLLKRINEILYSSSYNLNFEVSLNIHEQSVEIGSSVQKGGAGDQGIMYGFATNETESMLPYGYKLVTDIVKFLDQLEYDWLLPDGKAQVSLQGDRVSTLFISVQHKNSVELKQFRSAIEKEVREGFKLLDSSTEILINPAGSFTKGGFEADSGLTGKKTAVDTYGGLVPHGGGSFSGKDATKVDRSGTYMARHAAKSIVSRGIAEEALVSVAYAIGKKEPVMLAAHNEKFEDISEYLRTNFDFRPEAIIERLELRNPIYKETASYGHFTDNRFSWEGV